MCPVVQNDIRDHKGMISLDNPYFPSSITSSFHVNCLIFFFWFKKMEVTEQDDAHGAGSHSSRTARGTGGSGRSSLSLSLSFFFLLCHGAFGMFPYQG